jgi:hypothetical protein
MIFVPKILLLTQALNQMSSPFTVEESFKCLWNFFMKNEFIIKLCKKLNILEYEFETTYYNYIF